MKLAKLILTSATIAGGVLAYSSPLSTGVLFDEPSSTVAAYSNDATLGSQIATASDEFLPAMSSTTPDDINEPPFQQNYLNQNSADRPSRPWHGYGGWSPFPVFSRPRKHHKHPNNHKHHHRHHHHRHHQRHHHHRHHHHGHAQHHHGHDGNPHWFPSYCHLPGQVCSKLKRAVDSASLSLADPDPNPKDHPCNSPGEPCHRAKQSAENLSMAIEKADAIIKRDPNTEASWFQRFCHLPGQGCSKVRRAAEDIYAFLDESAHENDAPEDDETKRAMDELRQAADDALAAL